VGIASTIILQIIFSQWGLMNKLFYTAPLASGLWTKKLEKSRQQ
jgi:Ca2+-transporting ATPase